MSLELDHLLSHESRLSRGLRVASQHDLENVEQRVIKLEQTSHPPRPCIEAQEFDLLAARVSKLEAPKFLAKKKTKHA